MRLTSIAFLVVLAGARVAAQPTTPEAEARRHYEDGSKAFALGEFSRAVAEYRAAFNAKPDPAFLYNIAQAYRLSGDLSQALFFYRSFLNQMPDTPNRAEVERRIGELTEQVQRQKQIQAKPPNSAVSPSQLKAMPGQPVPVPAAPRVSTTPATTTPASATLTASLPSPQRKPAYKKWWVWTIVGVAVAGAAVGAGIGVSQAGSGGPSTHFGTTPVF